MATRHLHLKGLRTNNILHRLVNDAFQTGCGPNSLSCLSEDSDLPYLSAVDKALVSVFRRLNGSSFQRDQKDDLSLSPGKSAHGTLGTAAFEKRSRIGPFDFQHGYRPSYLPRDGLDLLLDLMPITGSNANGAYQASGSVSSEDGRVREFRNAGYSRTDDGSRAGGRTRETGGTGIGAADGRSGIDTNSDDEFSTKVAKRFVQLGGLRIVISILLLGTNHRPRFKEANIKSPGSELIVKDVATKKLCLEVLARLCCLQKETADVLNEYKEVCSFCFHCLACDALRDSACKLIELFLMARPEMLNLCSIPRLKEVLSVLDGKKMGSLCRILAITVSDLDIYENKQSLLAQNQQKRSNEFVPTRDINQELIMSVPGLLKKIVRMAVNDRYMPRYPNAPTEIDHWMRFIDDHISNEIANDLGGVRPNTSFTVVVP